MVYLDMGILVAGWLTAQVVFHGYEAHVPFVKRTTKLAVLFVCFLAVHRFAGRWIFFALLLLMTVAIGVLHGYWFHCRHGVHWRTAEPRDKYLQLISLRTRRPAARLRIPMPMIERIFETHIHVHSLRRSMQFYEDVIGLTLGTLDAGRQIAFYWVGGPNVSMLGLWEKPEESIVSQHFAFQIPEAGFPRAIENLRRNGIPVYNFLDDGTEAPMVFAWMPAVSIYFRDPDGHELEYIAPLQGPPHPEAGIISVDQWNRIKNGGKQ